MTDLVDAVEKIFDLLESLKLSQQEAVVVTKYTHDILQYNSMKAAIADEIKTELLKELQTLKKKVK